MSPISILFDSYHVGREWRQGTKKLAHRLSTARGAPGPWAFPWTTAWCSSCKEIVLVLNTSERKEAFLFAARLEAGSMQLLVCLPGESIDEFRKSYCTCEVASPVLFYIDDILVCKILCRCWVTHASVKKAHDDNGERAALGRLSRRSMPIWILAGPSSIMMSS